VEYVVECGVAGKIFTRNPLEAREVELWLRSINEKSILHAELGYTGGMAVLQIADLILKRTAE
jgi:hypothetical protein